jgi:hypothetical protein
MSRLCGQALKGLPEKLISLCRALECKLKLLDLKSRTYRLERENRPANRFLSFLTGIHFQQIGGFNRLLWIADRETGLNGGGRGIRTPVTFAGKAVFKTACFNRSHIPPQTV